MKIGFFNFPQKYLKTSEYGDYKLYNSQWTTCLGPFQTSMLHLSCDNLLTFFKWLG